MNKSMVIIKMTMEIIDAEQTDVTTTEAAGQLLEKGNMTVLRFSEKNENQEQTDSLITIHSEHVSVKRSGAVSMLQKFRKNQLTENVYRHQFGTVHMETETEHIIYEPPTETETGKLLISYTTSLNGDTPRKHNLTITWKREK